MGRQTKKPKIDNNNDGRVNVPIINEGNDSDYENDSNDYENDINDNDNVKNDGNDSDNDTKQQETDNGIKYINDCNDKKSMDEKSQSQETTQSSLTNKVCIHKKLNCSIYYIIYIYFL